MLARFGALLTPQTRTPVSEIVDQMKELHFARQALVKDRTAALNRQKQMQLTSLKRLASQRPKQIDRQFKVIDAALAALRGSDTALKARFDILMSIPGIGATTAFAGLIDTPESGTLENPWAAGFVRLAPVARDTGRWSGKRSVRGGRANLRRTFFFVPALVATRCNPDFKAKYQAMIGAGNPPKIAIVAVIRRLVVLANGPLKAGRNWQPK